MRELIFHTLKTDPGKPAVIGNPVRIFQWGSLGHNGIPARPEFPFLLVMEQPATANREVRDTAPKSHKRNFQIMAYDERGEGYLRIEQVLRWVRDTLQRLTGATSPSGARCTNVVWTGFSVDSKDVDYGANVKWSTFSFVANE